MAVWTTPIYDRTSDDITDAKNILTQITEMGFNSLSAEDVLKWNAGFRGAFTFQTANRIEGNIEYLNEVLSGLGYFLPVRNVKTNWNRNDIPNVGLDSKIIENTRSLIDGTYPVVGITLPTSLEFPDIDNVNAVENIHQILYDRIDKIKNGYRYCGVTYCG